MFGFDGNFKNKRPINIGGRPVTLSKDQLLEKNKLERLERERIRLSNLSASKIQSFYRNRSKLKKEFNLERSNWSSPKTITQIPSALSQLESFYNIVLDRQKLLDILELININKQFLDSLWSLKDVYLVANWTLCLKRLVVLSTPLIFFNSTVVFLEQMIDSIGSVLNLNLYSQNLQLLITTINKQVAWIKNNLISESDVELNQTIFTFTLQILNIGVKLNVQNIISKFIENHLISSPNILTISPSVTQLIPFNEISAAIRDFNLKNLDSKSVLDLFCNYISLGEFKLSEIDIFGLESYVRSLNYIVENIPENVFQSLHKLTIVNDDMDIDEDEQNDAISTVPDIVLEDYQIKNLSYLTQQQHLKSIIRLSDNVSSFQPLCYFLITIISRWPHEKFNLSSYILFKCDKMFPKVLLQSFNKSILAQKLQTETSFASLINDSLYLPDWSTLMLFCELYSRLLFTMADEEFFSIDGIIVLADIIPLTLILKKIVYELYWNPSTMTSKGHFCDSILSLTYGREIFSRILSQIYTRDTRKKFTDSDHWLWSDNVELFNCLEQIPSQTSDEYQPSPTTINFKSDMILACQAILTDIPFVIPFERRVNLFRNYVKHDRKELNIELTGWMAPVSNVTIRRSQVFEDGYAQLDRLGPLLKNRIAISFVDKYGQMESGQDGGGLFKEFMTSCLKQAFDKNLGLFHVNEENLLYPAPTSYASELEQLQLFKFLGRIIGKALYEGILVDAAFASFFLSKWLGKRNYLYDLPSLDPEFYQSLMFLKNYAGDISDLCLTMTVTTEIFGQTTNVDLIKNGSNINVTAENRIQYIYLVANYKLNVQIARQCSAFFQGLVDLINPRWIKMFNEQELQILIGGLQVPIDINNLKQFTTYGGVFDEHHPTIVMFWNVIETFDDSQRSKLIKFITSCSRPPLLGFGELNPRLCIRFAGQDQTRLPTASTCVNLLKLPAYLDEETLRDKLIYSINAEAGFDLT